MARMSLCGTAYYTVCSTVVCVQYLLSVYTAKYSILYSTIIVQYCIYKIVHAVLDIVNSVHNIFTHKEYCILRTIAYTMAQYCVYVVVLLLQYTPHGTGTVHMHVVVLYTL